MRYAIELYFDHRTEAALRDIWQQIAFAGVDATINLVSGRPHMALAVYDKLNVPEAMKTLREISLQSPAFPLTFAGVGTFPSPRTVLFLAPSASMELLTLHQEVHRRFAADRDAAWDYYLPGNWVPHSTLALDVNPDRVHRGLDICFHVNLPLHAQVEEIALIEFRPVKEYCAYRLVR